MKKEKEDRKRKCWLSKSDDRCNDIGSQIDKKVIDAVNVGISKSKYINNTIIGCNKDNIDGLRVAITCICNIQTELELITDITAKNNIRKELNKLCHALR